MVYTFPGDEGIFLKFIAHGLTGYEDQLPDSCYAFRSSEGVKEAIGRLQEDMRTGSSWFFPLLTTDRGLKEIDACLQEYLRYTVTGRHYKGNYRISYEQLRQWAMRAWYTNITDRSDKRIAFLPHFGYIVDRT